MKINVEIDCTPEELRRAVGLPDLTALHDRYLTMMGNAMAAGVTPEAMEAMVRSWAPMGEAGMAAWRRLLEGRIGGKPGG